MARESSKTAIQRSGESTRAWFVGGGIGALAGAAFLVRDGGVPGPNITVLEELPLSGGSCDGIGTPEGGYVIRGGRMLNSPTYECTWDLFRSIPSLATPGRSVFDETMEFNARIKTHSRARLVDRNRFKVDVSTLGFSARDRFELLRLILADEDAMGSSRITEWFSPRFFETNFWLMWATTFAFQPWHSAAELRRYMLRFMHEFPRIHTLAGVTRTIYNQYDSLVLPLQRWLAERGVRFETSCRVTDLDLRDEGGQTRVAGITCERASERQTIPVAAADLVFVTNGSMTEASSLGSMTKAPELLPLPANGSFALWEKVAQGRPQFGNPRAFDDRAEESRWESFTATLRDPAFFERMVEFSGNSPGTGALVTFKDSSWLMSVVLAHQPHFMNQPADVQVFWGYGLYPDRVGNFVPKRMLDCTGEEILRELCGHLGFELSTVERATCIPCVMPFITSQFLPRVRSDRPLPVPPGSVNLGFISQFVEIPDDVVFTVEYSVRAAQMAVYELMGIEKPIPPVSRHDRTAAVKLRSLVTAFH